MGDAKNSRMWTTPAENDCRHDRNRVFRKGTTNGAMKGSIPFLLISMAAAGVARADLPITGLVFRDDPAPGIPNWGSYHFLTVPCGAADGHRIAFGALVTGPGVDEHNDIAAYYGPPAAPVLAAREGSPPDFVLPGSYIVHLRAPSINASGTVLFSGTLSWVEGGVGLYRRSGAGVFEKIAETHDPIDGLPDRRLDKQLYGNRIPIDNAGTAYVLADIYGSNINVGNKVAILRAAPGNVTTLARQGITPPPGVPNPLSNIFFGSFHFLNANASGKIAFIAFITNSSIYADYGIWTDAPGVLTLLVRKGDPVPNLPGVTISEFPNAIGIGDDGTVGFCARLTGPGVNADNELSVWTGVPGALKLIAREGDPAPGLGAGVLFDTFLAGAYETGPAVNPYGQVAFVARLRGPGITTANDDTLWAQDGNGTLRLVVREGSAVPRPGSTTAIVGTSNPALFPPFTFHPVGGFASGTRLVFAAETDAGAGEGIYAARIPDETTPPTIRAGGAKNRKTRRPTSRIVGTASDNRSVAKVEAKVRKAAYRRIAGTTRWTFTARLKRGGNRILFRATDAAGNVSRPAVVRRLRKA